MTHDDPCIDDILPVKDAHFPYVKLPEGIHIPHPRRPIEVGRADLLSARQEISRKRVVRRGVARMIEKDGIIIIIS